MNNEMSKGWRYVIEREEWLRNICSQSCRGCFHLVDEIYSDVVFVRVPRMVDETFIPELGVPLDAYIKRNLRWYIFKYLNARMEVYATECDDVTEIETEPFYYVDRSTFDTVQDIMKGLDDYDKHIMYLHVVEGMSFTDMSALLDTPRSTVRLHYLRALEKAQLLAAE